MYSKKKLFSEYIFLSSEVGFLRPGWYSGTKLLGLLRRVK